VRRCVTFLALENLQKEMRTSRMGFEL